MVNRDLRLDAESDQRYWPQALPPTPKQDQSNGQPEHVRAEACQPATKRRRAGRGDHADAGARSDLLRGLKNGRCPGVQHIADRRRHRQPQYFHSAHRLDSGAAIDRIQTAPGDQRQPPAGSDKQMGDKGNDGHRQLVPKSQERPQQNIQPYCESHTAPAPRSVWPFCNHSRRGSHSLGPALRQSFGKRPGREFPVEACGACGEEQLCGRNSDAFTGKCGFQRGTIDRR